MSCRSVEISVRGVSVAKSTVTTSKWPLFSAKINFVPSGATEGLNLLVVPLVSAETSIALRIASWGCTDMCDRTSRITELETHVSFIELLNVAGRTECAGTASSPRPL
jgi:hypothetical protein